MEILRKGYPSIIKNEILLDDLDLYDEKKIEEAGYLLRDTIVNYPVNTIGMITILRKKYEKSLMNTYEILKDNLDYDMVRYNCYYLARILHARLKNININTYFMTHKAHYFALTSGDKKMKEAHISLIYPTIHNDRVLYTIFDPGLKIDVPMSFYKDAEMNTIIEEQLTINIKKNTDIDYPYFINLDGINPYSYNSNAHNVRQEFNPRYETVELDKLAYPISYRLLTGYKATIFAREQEKRAYIILNHLSKTLEFYDGLDGIRYYYTFLQLYKIDKQVIRSQIKNACLMLSLDLDEMIEDIYFMIDVVDEFNNKLMDQDVVNEYSKVMLKRK